MGKTLIKVAKNQDRESNFELLRIIAMFMVLVLHADFQAFGHPTIVELSKTPLSSTLRIFIEMVSIVAVNVFVLISGWFGIRPCFKGFLSFVFQCHFFSIIIYVLLLLAGQVSLSMKGIAGCFMLLPGSYWFILSYIGLYIFSPLLNAFINTADKKIFFLIVVSFFIFQFFFSFCGNSAPFLMKGYSTLSFMGLYLLGSYARKYSLLINKRVIFLIYTWLAITLIMTLSYICAKITDCGFIYNRLLNYSNPLIIVSALLLIIFTSRFRFKSRFVNRLSTSVFAVYLLHCNPNLYNYYLESIHSVEHNSILVRGLIILIIICAWFCISVLLDQLRIRIWNIIVTKLDIDRYN